MKTKTREAIIQYHDAVVNLAGTVAVTMFFLSGLGRYRVVLVYAAYCLINSILSIGTPGRKVSYVLLPATLVAIYLDITNGPLHPAFPKNSLLLALALMLIIDNLVRRYTLKTIETISEGRIFCVCPKCKYDNKKLVETCSFCSYRNGEQLESSKAKYFGKIPAKVIRMVGLVDDESVLFYLRLFPFRSVVKNGERQIRTYFIITTSRVVFLDYFFFSESWREKDVLPIRNIVSIEGKMKKIYLSEEPFLEISTSDNYKYEIIFKKLDRYTEYFSEITKIIKDRIPTEG